MPLVRTSTPAAFRTAWVRSWLTTKLNSRPCFRLAVRDWWSEDVRRKEGRVVLNAVTSPGSHQVGPAAGGESLNSADAGVGVGRRDGQNANCGPSPWSRLKRGVGSREIPPRSRPKTPIMIATKRFSGAVCRVRVERAVACDGDPVLWRRVVGLGLEMRLGRRRPPALSSSARCGCISLSDLASSSLSTSW
jgi:hypothetical protein